MKKALFIQHSATSHYNGAFPIAECLKNNGYEVHYYAEKKFVKHITSHGFKYYLTFTKPVVEKLDEKFMRKENIVYPYDERIKDGIYNYMFGMRRYELRHMIDTLEPDIVLADTYNGTDFIIIYDLLKEKKIKFFFIETMLSSIESAGVPYLKSKAFPEEKLKIKWESFIRRSALSLYRLYKKCFYFGYDNHSQIMKEMKRQQMGDKYPLDDKNFIDVSLKNITTFVTSPIELEFFEKPQLPNRHYLGLNLDENYDTKVEERLQQIIDQKRKIIYISFGTVFLLRDGDTIKKFLDKVNDILGRLEVNAIFTLGAADWTKEIKDLTNIHIFKRVPQQHLLKYCSMFITHGGLNSFKESIMEAVPMLVYPIDIDQVGNARKVAYKKMGLLGELKTDRKKEIERKINLLLNENDRFKQNIREFRDRVLKTRNVKKIIPIIEETAHVQ